MRNVVVIFGGVSCEHDISIITGLQLISRCNSTHNNIIPVYISKDGEWFTGDKLIDIDNIKESIKKSNRCTILPNSNYLYVKKGKCFKPKFKIDVAILCLHGKNGEDGAIPALMQLSNIPYTSSALCGSAICLDKFIFKLFCQGLGVQTVPGFSLCEKDYYLNSQKFKDDISVLGYPVILKPSRLGSSIGIEVCDDESVLHEKLKQVFAYDKKILVEKYVDVAKEINIAVLDDKGTLILSNTEEPVRHDDILSFNEKYKNSGGFEAIKRISPAEIGDEIDKKIRDIATLCYSNLELFGVVRLDFILDKNDNLFLNEINTIPGSMANYLFDKKSLDYSKLIDVLVSSAIHRKNQEDEIIKFFDTDVLDEGFDGFKK